MTKRPVVADLGPSQGPIADGLPASYGVPPPPPALTGAITLGDRYGPRPNSPAGTPCRPRWIIPAAWRVTLGATNFTVTNKDPRGPQPIVPSGAFVACEGRFYPSLTYYGELTY